MRIVRLQVLVVLAVLPILAGSAPVHAETVAPGPAETVVPGPAVRTKESLFGPVALGVNTPVGWLTGSFAASLYVGLGRHHAVRGNFARYQDLGITAEAVIQTVQFRGSPSHSGDFTDFGISWVWYPRRLWQGFMVEAGALRRDRDTKIRQEADDTIETRSTAYAGRAMIGWSWLVRRHLFIALGAGASMGYESGHETITPDKIQPMPTTQAIGRTRIDGEAYLRIGFAIGG